VCRREAPGVEQFARAHESEVEVIGLGTLDSLGEAEDFIDDYGTTSFTMLWDETFESWQHYGVASQPAAELLSPDGEIIAGWLGAFPEDEVLQLAADASG
jgi:hypothetical protein